MLFRFDLRSSLVGGCIVDSYCFYLSEEWVLLLWMVVSGLPEKWFVLLFIVLTAIVVSCLQEEWFPLLFLVLQQYKCNLVPRFFLVLQEFQLCAWLAITSLQTMNHIVRCMGACCHSYKYNWCWRIDITQIQRTRLNPILHSVFDFSLIVIGCYFWRGCFKQEELWAIYMQWVSL